MVKFEAKPLNDKVKIKWITASEHDNDYFTLERSNNCNDFKPIAKISGVGNSTQLKEYSYTDNDPFPGNNYYRLKQTDFNGQSETFKPIVVNLKSTKAQPDLLTLGSSNPFNNYLSVNYNAPEEGVIQLKLINSNGIETRSITQEVSPGLNRFVFENPEEIKSGIYFITGTQKDLKLNVIKVIKQ